MDLTKAVLPDSVLVSGKYFKVRTGHPYWFRFSEICSQERIFAHEFNFIYDGDPPEDGQAGFQALYNFFCEPREVPRSEGDGGERILDYAVDADLVYAAVLQCYGIDLLEKEWHWHKVRAMIAGVQGTRLNDVLWYRSCDAGKNKELARMKWIWALPERADAESREALDAFNEVFYGA